MPSSSSRRIGLDRNKRKRARPGSPAVAKSNTSTKLKQQQKQQQQKQQYHKQQDHLVPNIKGVPTALTPLLIQTVKQIGKLLKKSSKNNNNDMNEIDFTQLEKNKTTIVQKFLSSIRPHSIKIHVSILTFLLSTIVDKNHIHGNVSIHNQRSALYISHQLLLCSKACREAFAQCNIISSSKDHESTNDATLRLQTISIKSFIDALLPKISDQQTNNNINGDEHYQTKHLLLQDAIQMLHQLSQDYGDFYPRFIVAYRFISERTNRINCFQGSKMTKTTTNNSDREQLQDQSATTTHHSQQHSFLSISQLRSARDDALNCGEIEIKRVQHWIDKANVCFEILVPRMGYGVDASTTNTFRSHSVTAMEAITTTKQDSKYIKKETLLGQDQDQNQNDDDSDGLDIDWEDGDDDEHDIDIDNNNNYKKTELQNKNYNYDENPFDNDGTKSNSTHEIHCKHKHESEKDLAANIHRENVERTLKVMLGGDTSNTNDKSSTGFTKAIGIDYSVEIDLGGAPAAHTNEEITKTWNEKANNGEEFTISDIPEHTTSQNSVEENKGANGSYTYVSTNSSTVLEKVATSSATNTLQTCVNKLAYIHLPRLQLWVNGLISADDMTSINFATKSPTSSLHRLPIQQRKKRKLMLDNLMEFKTNAASILSFAFMLGIRPTKRENNVNQAEPQTISNSHRNPSVIRNITNTKIIPSNNAIDASSPTHMNSILQINPNYTKIHSPINLDKTASSPPSNQIHAMHEQTKAAICKKAMNIKISSQQKLSWRKLVLKDSDSTSMESKNICLGTKRVHFSHEQNSRVKKKNTSRMKLTIKKYPT